MKLSRIVFVAALSAATLTLSACDFSENLTQIVNGVSNGNNADAEVVEQIDEVETTTNDSAAQNSDPRDTAAALDTLQVRHKTFTPGYERDLFPHWTHFEDQPCASDDMAFRRYANLELSGDGCREVAGSMTDPYSGQEVSWGSKRTNIVEVDHVVSLSDAWNAGMFHRGGEERLAFANDPLNLIPTTAEMNGSAQKWGNRADEWLPPTHEGRCLMVSTQIAVKDKYGLSVIQSEKDAMAEVLGTCPQQKLPAH